MVTLFIASAMATASGATPASAVTGRWKISPTPGLDYNGFLDDVEVSDIRKWESEYLSYIDAKKPEILDKVRTEKTLGDDLKAEIDESIKAFGSIR